MGWEGFREPVFLGTWFERRTAATQGLGDGRLLTDSTLPRKGEGSG
jgi:hypothetical protein